MEFISIIFKLVVFTSLGVIVLFLLCLLIQGTSDSLDLPDTRARIERLEQRVQTLEGRDR